MRKLHLLKELKVRLVQIPYEQVSTIIENGQSFAVNECICKKEKGLADEPCAKPIEVCLAIAPVPGVFEGNHPWGGRVISKEEAYPIQQRLGLHFC